MTTDALPRETQPLLWSVRRELWENRSLSVAPPVVAGVYLLAFAVSTIDMVTRRHASLIQPYAQQRAAIELPYDIGAMVLIVTAMLVGAFYCLDALHGERRDRSILFWKSLPVSDLTAVLAKACIPLVVLPLFTFVVVMVLETAMWLLTSARLLPSGLSGTTFTVSQLGVRAIVLGYGLLALALWHAPIYAWLLLVSAWAKRAVILWAVMPVLLIGVFERVVFGTFGTAAMLRYRFLGHLTRTFEWSETGRLRSLTQLTPATYLATPGLWIGLVLAAVMLAAAVRIRRDRGPI